MARSSEQPENGWLSALDIRGPGLLSSGSECKFPEPLPLQRELPPMVTVGAGVPEVSWERKESAGRGWAWEGDKPEKRGGPVLGSRHELQPKPKLLSSHPTSWLARHHLLETRPLAGKREEGEQGTKAV